MEKIRKFLVIIVSNISVPFALYPCVSPSIFVRQFLDSLFFFPQFLFSFFFSFRCSYLDIFRLRDSSYRRVQSTKKPIKGILNLLVLFISSISFYYFLEFSSLSFYCPSVFYAVYFLLDPLAYEL